MSEISRERLMAHADGQLSLPERERLEAELAEHPDAAGELTQLRRQIDAIRTLYGPVLTEPVPERLDIDRLSARRTARRQRFWSMAAAAIIVLGVGIGTGWMLRASLAGPTAAERLIASAVSAHTVYAGENRHAVEVPGSDSAHLTSWLSSRLDTQLALPDLSAWDLTFLGGRLLPAPDSPGGRAAQLMYEDRDGERLTLYVTPAGAPGPGYQLASLGLDTALYWADDVLTCTITAPYAADRVRAIARSVFGQLSPRAPLYSPS
ncbi:MAG: anti-sigma factor [Devosia sp.]|nr:anti-sigma factor [Devosia sp.]